MFQIIPHLHFDGVARDAMEFYKTIFGGKLNMMTIAESPMKDEMSKSDQAKIMHSSLKKGDRVLVTASDMMDPSSFTPGDTFTMGVDCESERQINDLFGKLSQDGKVSMALKEEFWGGIFGMVTDKFGVDWMLNYQKPSAKRRRKAR